VNALSLRIHRLSYTPRHCRANCLRGIAIADPASGETTGRRMNLSVMQGVVPEHRNGARMNSPTAITLGQLLGALMAKLSTLPDDFRISEDVRLWAERKGFTRLDEHLEAFLDYARSSGKKYADWDAAFRNAIRGNWAKLPVTSSVPQKSPVSSINALQIKGESVTSTIGKPPAEFYESFRKLVRDKVAK
jgi:hypothetical protein